MKICLLTEGSYPYVVGGVSSWCHQLIKAFPEHEFIILSIMPKAEDNIDIKYEMPDNVLDVQTIYLQGFRKYDPTPRKREPKLNSADIEMLRSFIRYKRDIDWAHVVRIVCNKRIFGNPIEFLHSRVFWDLLVEYYKEVGPNESFNQFFWTVRSMQLFFLTVMQFDIPAADIYHSVSTGYPGLLGLIATQIHNKPFLLTEHGIYAREREEDILKADWVQGIYKQMWIDFFYFISVGAYRVATRSISLFGRNRDIQIGLGSAPEKTMVIPNGVDLEQFVDEHLEHEYLNVGSILRVVPIKDVRTLIKAFRLVRNEIPKARLQLIGPYDEAPEYYEQCVQLIFDQNLKEDVEFTGRVDVKAALKKIDLLVLTSISEAMPLVILEGHSCGIPFVATDVGACREMLEGRDDDDLGVSGLVVNPVSPREIADAIIILLKDPQRRRKMAEIGRQRVQKYYQKSDFIDAYRQLYNELGPQE